MRWQHTRLFCFLNNMTPHIISVDHYLAMRPYSCFCVIASSRPCPSIVPSFSHLYLFQSDTLISSFLSALLSPSYNNDTRRFALYLTLPPRSSRYLCHRQFDHLRLGHRLFSLWEGWFSSLWCCPHIAIPILLQTFVLSFLSISLAPSLIYNCRW